MSDPYLVDPQGWEYDLQSIYSAYMGYFQLHGVPWHNRTWGQFFQSFDQFLAFSWPVVTVTDARTGQAHIVTRMSSVTAFLRMIKTRFGETLPQVGNMLVVTPVETSQRHLRHVNGWPAYRKLHATLPAVALTASKARIRAGHPTAIRELWATRNKTFLAVDFGCLQPERHDRVPTGAVVEWGYAVIRCGHLMAAGAWPPVPDDNYRKGHYVISEHASVSGNQASPSVLSQYAFGNSQVVPKANLPRIVQSVLSSLLSPDSESVANEVVLVTHGVQAVLQRLEGMKIKLPTNVFVIDIAYLERAIFNTGERGLMRSRRTGVARSPEALLTLGGILHSFGIVPPSLSLSSSKCTLDNAGNNAFMTLLAFQRMIDPKGGVGVHVRDVAGVGARAGADVGIGNRADTEAKASGPNENGHEVVHGKYVRGGSRHVRRAATVAARIFRPLGGTIVARPGRETDTKTKNGNENKEREELAQAQEPQKPQKPQKTFAGLGIKLDKTDARVDIKKRASTFSAQTAKMTAMTTTAMPPMLPRFQWDASDENEKWGNSENTGPSDQGGGEREHGGWRGSVRGSWRLGQRASSVTLLPSQSRRHSTTLGTR